MRIANLILLPLLSAALCAGLASASSAQGGWRQWEVRLRDGRRLEANPLGAPDDAHLSLSVGAYEGGAGRVTRALVSVVAALPVPDSLPVPVVGPCEDAIVRRDGTITLGHVNLTRVRWSEGVVLQRRDTVDLRDVAYIIFASRGAANANCGREPTWQQPDGTYPVGGGQMPRLCGTKCRT